MQHAAAVGVGHRVADVHEPPEQLPQRQRPLAGVAARLPVGAVEPLDRLLEAVAADEPHGVERPAVGVVAQAVDRHDPRVLQPAGDLGLQQEPRAALGVVGVPVLDLLQRHLAVQLLVARDVDLAQPAPGVRPEDAEPLARGRWARRSRPSPIAPREATRRPARPRGSRHRPEGGQAGLHVGVVIDGRGQVVAERGPPS